MLNIQGFISKCKRQPQNTVYFTPPGILWKSTWSPPIDMESCWSPPVVRPLLVQSIPSPSLVLIHSSPPPCGVHKESTWRISRWTNHKDYMRTSWGLHQDLERSPCPVLMKSLSTPVLIQVESTLSPHGRFSDETLSGFRTPPGLNLDST